MRVDVAGRSDVGRVRGNNEDNFKLVPELNLFVLSDGMGGEAHGEVASSMAVETIVDYCKKAMNGKAPPVSGPVQADLSSKTNHLVQAIRAANKAIYAKAQTDESHKGMGATIVCIWVDDQRLCVAHVGDSRAYMLRGMDLQQLTDDHSLVAEQVRRGIITPEQAKSSKMQSVLLRALGIDEEVEIDAAEHLLMEGDLVLMCTDGLDRMVSDEQIASALLTTPGAQPATDRLIELALEGGGEDNVTVVLFRVAGADGGFLTRLWRWLNGPMGFKSSEGGN